MADLLVRNAKLVATCDAAGRELAGGWVAVTGGVIEPFEFPISVSLWTAAMASNDVPLLVTNRECNTTRFPFCDLA